MNHVFQIVADTNLILFAIRAAAEEAFAARAKRASREKFLKAMAKVPGVEPEEYDKF